MRSIAFALLFFFLGGLAIQAQTLTEIPANWCVELQAFSKVKDSLEAIASNTVKIGKIRSKEIELLGRGYPVKECSLTRTETLLTLEIVTEEDQHGSYVLTLGRPFKDGEPLPVAALAVIWEPKGGTSSESFEKFTILLPE